ncbi:arfGAP with SH3 domain, ANK repeat and PH domain-containing protein-like [Macrobrachium nipponense]|uniref:arfGAP with SH3 domain, ANK repeat and PH domain-containing protein-like n=1 Tax=Macrobrachium nipponense TaxID=159736 RepID=UPI0030C7EDB1
MSHLAIALQSSSKYSQERAGSPGPSPADSGFRELQQRIISYVRGLPGNNLCCDCGGTNDVTWLSTNYGVMVCIECSGIHRDLGVHVSRIQSLTLDKVGTAQLLLARHMSNISFNEVTEATSPRKPEPTSTMDERREFIQSKYVRRAFVQPTTATPEDLLVQLREVIDKNDLYGLLRVYFQGGDLGLPLTSLGECALHVAIYQENGASLPLVDFLVQNSHSLDRQTKEGNTPLHYCVISNKPECMRLLLRVGANPSIENNNGKNPMDIASERNCGLMADMLNQALQQKKSMFENVEYEWNLSDDNLTDVSDDDENFKQNGMSTPEKRSRSRPVSLPGSSSPICQRSAEHRTYSDQRSVGEYRSSEHRSSTSRWSRNQPPPPPVSSKPICSTSDGRPLDTDTSPSSSPQESPNTFINGRSTESLSSLVSDDPRPPPRMRGSSMRQRRCQALYDCDADLDDELSFTEGEIIIVLKAETEDGDWMEGMIEGQPHRRGKVPINFVHMLSD